MTSAPPAKPKSGLPIIVIVLIVVGVLGLPALGVVGSLAIYGMTRYLRAAKTAEGQSNVRMLANGIVRCAATEGRSGPRGLPPSSAKVPVSLVWVRGRKYVSNAAEWHSDEAFRCAGFSMTTPQHFQYEWEKGTEHVGVARATADFDGDGAPDATFEVMVTCGASGCVTDAPRTK